jgi:hypothetical protein
MLPHRPSRRQSAVGMRGGACRDGGWRRGGGRGVASNEERHSPLRGGRGAAGRGRRSEPGRGRLWRRRSFNSPAMSPPRPPGTTPAATCTWSNDGPRSSRSSKGSLRRIPETSAPACESPLSRGRTMSGSSVCKRASRRDRGSPVALALILPNQATRFTSPARTNGDNREGVRASDRLLEAHLVGIRESERPTGLDLLPRLHRAALKEAVASELWPRN